MRRWLIIISVFILLAGVAEEATRGYLLLGQTELCEAIGGVRVLGDPTTRCFTRLCYWFGDCGRRNNPGDWAERLKPRDLESKVLLWLGEPDQRQGDYFEWHHCGKFSAGLVTATITGGRLVKAENLCLRSGGP